MKCVLIITLFLVIFDGIKSHAWQTQSQIGNNNAFQSGMSRFNSANSQQSDLLSENSGYTMVINLPTLLKALKKSSLQHNQLQQKPGKQQHLTQQQNSWPVQPSQQFSQQPQDPQPQSQFTPSRPMMAMQYPADTQPMPSQQQKSWPVHPSLQQPPQQLSQQPQYSQPQSQYAPSQPMMVMRYPADTQPMPSQHSQAMPSTPSQQRENTTTEPTDENNGTDIDSQLKVCMIFTF